jgi:hypothetical protein
MIYCVHCEGQLDWEAKVSITYSFAEAFYVCLDCGELPHKTLCDYYTSII